MSVGTPKARPRPPARPRQRGFDAQGHRGARGLRPENTLAAFATALDLGVTTLELDTGVSRDGVVVVCHERRISPVECRDTAPAFPGDPAHPYVGKLVKDLTLAQLKTLDCGTRRPADPATDAFLPTQEPVPGAPMPTLAEVFELVAHRGAGAVQFNVETKVDPTLPHETVDPTTFTRQVTRTIAAHGMTRRTTLQSFDWRTLIEARRRLPGLRRGALAKERTMFPGTPWTAGVSVGPRPFEGQLARLAKLIGAHVLLPRHTTLSDGLIRAARRRLLEVVPWTVNDPAAMHELIDRGVDGIITDYPDRLRAVMAGRAMRLPQAYPAAAALERDGEPTTYEAEDTLRAA